MRELNADANSFTDTLKRLSTVRRESKAAAEEVEKLLGKFKVHNKEFSMHSNQFDLAVRQAGEARLELAAAKRDVEQGASYRNCHARFARIIRLNFFRYLFSRYVPPEQEARLVELAEVAALRSQLDALATLEVRQCSIEAEVAAFKLRATAERRAQLQRAVAAAQREHALVTNKQAERDRAAAAENVRGRSTMLTESWFLFASLARSNCTFDYICVIVPCESLFDQPGQGGRLLAAAHARHSHRACRAQRSCRLGRTRRRRFEWARRFQSGGRRRRKWQWAQQPRRIATSPALCVAAAHASVVGQP